LILFSSLFCFHYES